MAETKHRWQTKVATRTGGAAAAGYLTIVLFAGSFGLWASTAPLAGAAIAGGVVAAAGQNVRIQHLEGGIIREVKVREGERVKAGEPVIILDSTVVQAELNRRISQALAWRAKGWRLQAEAVNADQLAPIEGADKVAKVAEFEEVLAEQRNEFIARQARYRSEQAILRQRIAALEEVVLGFEAQERAGEDQLTIVREEIGRKKGLLDKGLAQRSEYAALMRAEAEILGNVGEFRSQAASSKTQIVEAREQIEKLTTARMETATAELNTVRINIADLEEQIRATQSVLDRTVVRAPVDGIVVRALYNSPGSVVRPGEQIVDILPTTDELIIEAQLQPHDIDNVQIGQDVRMRFTALNARVTPEVHGTLFYISADRQVDQTGRPFYIARIRISENLPPEVQPEQIYPGMPVETYIATGDRTFVGYLVQPLMDSFARAFREE